MPIEQRLEVGEDEPLNDDGCRAKWHEGIDPGHGSHLDVFVVKEDEVPDDCDDHCCDKISGRSHSRFPGSDADDAGNDRLGGALRQADGSSPRIHQGTEAGLGGAGGAAASRIGSGWLRRVPANKSIVRLNEKYHMTFC